MKVARILANDVVKGLKSRRNTPSPDSAQQYKVAAAEAIVALDFGQDFAAMQEFQRLIIISAGKQIAGLLGRPLEKDELDEISAIATGISKSDGPPPNSL